MRTVIELFETRDRAEMAVESLKLAGFTPEDISIVMRDGEEAAEVAGESDAEKSSEESILTAGIGGGLFGGLGGAILGGALVAIPGIGPVMAAGPIVTALIGGIAGLTTGGVVGALTMASLTEEDAEYYQSGLKRGGILVSVNVPDGREAEARDVLHARPTFSSRDHRNR